jgi:hypothetical protein
MKLKNYEKDINLVDICYIQVQLQQFKLTVTNGFSPRFDWAQRNARK